MSQELSITGELNGRFNEINIDLNESSILDILPAGVYICDLSGRIIKYNEQAAILWGRRPKIGDDLVRFCGAHKLFNPDGSRLFHNQTPVAACLKDGLPRKEMEVIIEREDRSRVYVKVSVVPVKNKEGIQTGAINCFHDITTQKETEKQLNRKTVELEDYIENATIGLHWVDADGIIKWANKAEMEMLGYSPNEYIGQHISRFHIHREKIEDILLRLANNEVLNQYESQLRCRDGSIKTVHISSSVFWEDGQFKHTRCFTVDVTKQRELMESLLKSEFRYRNLFESLDVPLYITDTGGRIILYNQAAVALWGREPEIGKDLWCGSYKIMNQDGAEMPLDHCPMAVCLKEHRPVYGEQIVIVRPDGAIRNAIPHPRPVFDESGNMTGAINMLVDITPLKQTEQALRDSEEKLRRLAASLEQLVEERTKDLAQQTLALQQSEERYHKMVNEVEDYAIILLDKDGIIQNWNKGAEKIKGYREDEIIGKGFQTFYLQDDKDNGLHLKLLKEARENGKATHEGWRVRKDGSTFWASVLLTTLHNDRHEIIGFSKVTRDLTQRKQAEDKMKDYLAQLEFQNKELEQFAYAASHDMKEPLRKIHFYNSYIAERASGLMDEKSREYLNRSLLATERMKKLIDDLLNYSSYTSNAEGLQPVDINMIVQEIIQQQREELDEKNISIEFQVLPVIEAVPFQIKQLLHNLVQNAIKYRHPDRNCIILMKSEMTNGWEIARDTMKRYHKISVSDNGIGFEPQYAAKIFKLFHRLNNQSRESGSGIGLAICKKIVQNHQGYIKATGQPGEGASFDIYLPAL